MPISKIVVTNADGSTVEFDAPSLVAQSLGDRFFPSFVVQAAQESHKKYWPRGPFVSVNLAQWALESGYGHHTSGFNNYFGIQANEEQIKAGAFTWRMSREQVNGVFIPKYERFANYPTLADCFDAHAKLLTSENYKPCIAAQTPEAYCVALKECGYATADNYAQDLIDLIHVHNLKQWDQRF